MLLWLWAILYTFSSESVALPHDETEQNLSFESLDCLTFLVFFSSLFLALHDLGASMFVVVRVRFSLINVKPSRAQLIIFISRSLNGDDLLQFDSRFFACYKCFELKLLITTQNLPTSRRSCTKVGVQVIIC